MLSVLISTYNYNTFSLVKEIHSQLIKSKIVFEIICFDDASLSELNKQNQEINKLSFSSFQTLENNIGRSAIRNLLAKKAMYKWLLFLDGDVFPKSKTFISNYISFFSKKEKVFCGGIAYKERKQKELRYVYGKKYEEISLAIRELHSDKYFFTSNFLIDKKVFTKIGFNEHLTNYGYEDLLFSKKLKENSISIQQIENSIYHEGIDTNKRFVKKTEQSIKNLVFLLNNNLLKIDDTTLTKTYKKLNSFRLVSLLLLGEKIFKKIALEKSSIFFFNLYRLSYLHQVIKNSK